MQNNRVHAVFTSVIALWYTEYSSPSLLYLCAYKEWRKYLKLRKHTFKNIEKFFQSLMDKPVFEKSLFLPDKLICLSKTCVSNAPGSPWGILMPSPRGCDNIANAPSPGLTTWANAPRLPEGGGGGENGHRCNWLMHKPQCFLKEYFSGTICLILELRTNDRK